MKRSRATLLVASSAMVLLLLGGGLAVRVGAADTPYRHVIRFSEVLSLVLENYVDPVDTSALLEGAYEGMLGGLDASGTYLTPQEVAEWTAGGAEDYVDPGVSVLKAFGALQVVSVTPGSPAEEAGIVAGDQIRRVDGRPLRDLSLEQAVRLLRGKPGSTVSLSLLHTREGFRREEILLRRRKISERPYRLEIRDGIAVLTLREPARIATEELTAELREARSAGVEKLLLDVRNVVDEGPRRALPLLGLFAQGEILRLKDRSGQEIERLVSPSTETAWPGPLAVLVNGTTAGSAEALTRLLQDQHHATVYGEPTYGRAAEPRLFKLPDGSGLLLPAFRWETASGRSWDGEGVKPDLVVAAEGPPAEANASQLRRAIEAFGKPAEAPAAPQRQAA